MTENPTGQPSSFIGLNLGFLPLAFFFYACSPIVEINGKPVNLGWGNHQFDFAPGDYHVRIYFRYLFLERCGDNQVQFSLTPGETKTVKFYMWPWVFAPGSISVH